ncbi:TonB-dependent receptor [Sphingomonas naphthae]|uniref:TonB-dependent receptor n=1 Tax=Sphingomonas naphthae TaxID=1813468 RepID=A0ABY7THW5_9SPHN|nr:TonB-dependent receptor [Sphingomonas naphthae]WCT72739.1 TonB-dependent receptor [Sphingomonas naphthae]
MVSVSMGRGWMLAGGALLALTTPAFAEAPAAAEPATAAAPAEAEGLDEIVVTATKRETNLQKTPIAINVLSTQALQDRHVQSLYDLADGAIPSLRVATFEARQTALTIGIRGIVPLDANQPAREQGVGIYVDGVYLGRQHGLNAALFEVERVEVLKGPQGTLFGRNTEGGALSIVSKAPTGEFGGSATAGIANYGGYNGQFHLNLPEFANIALKFDGVVQYQGPTTKNPLSGQTGFNYFDRRGARAAARWKPTTTLTVDLSYDIGYDANSPFYSQLLNYNPNGCTAGPVANSPKCVLPGTGFTTLSGTVKPVSPLVKIEGNDRMKVADIGVPQQPSIDRTHGYVAKAGWKATDWVELRSITAWRDVSSIQYDNVGGAHRPPIVSANCTGTGCNFSRYSLADLYQHQFSQEFQAVGNIGQLDFVGGLYYFNERVSDDAATPSSLAFNSTLTAVTVLDPCRGSGGFGWQVGCRSIDRASAAKAKSYAVFGQATYNLDTLHFTVGGRNTWDDRDGRLLTVNNAPRSLTYSQNTSRFDPMAVVAWDASQDINLYAKYSTGYRSGGASSRSVSYREFGPEKVKAYEIGAKTQFFDRRVRLNLAGYIMDRTGSQIDFSSVSFDPATGANRNTVETVNAPGTTKIRGVEADLTVNPVEGLTLGASYAYTYTNIPATLNPFTNILQKVYIVFTPRNAASGTIDYSVPVAGDFANLKFHVDGNYSDATQTFDQAETKNDKSFIVNARLSLADIDMGRGTRLTVSAWSRNLFNTAYVYRRDPANSLPAFGSGTTGNINNVLGDYGNFNAPRTFGLEGSVRF